LSAKIIPVEPFDLTVFGATSDLARRKLLPGLYHRDRDRQLPPECRIIGVARRGLGREGYVAQIEEALRRYVAAADIEEGCLARFLERLDYVAADASNPETWSELVARFEGRSGIRVFYLATSPELFGQTCESLGAAGLVTRDTRVVLEKPIGHDLASAQAINDKVGAVFQERQVFRIDHYLGKETVQNLSALRFANVLFEPLWNARYIDHVQIMVAEDIGVEGRGTYYDGAGALRDMVQNHMLQLLCLVAMEPPTRFDADSVRDEKLKVLRALKPIAGEEVNLRTVRGQYRAGAVGGGPATGYIEELDTDSSTTETFVAIKAEIESWRWSGVPFYLRTGKRLPSRASEIVIQFRKIPHSIFEPSAGTISSNRLVVRLQPDEGIKLFLMAKDPGPGGMRLREAHLNLSFAETFRVRYPDAYERLLMDVVRGNPTLFMRRDEVEAAWTWVEPILEAWSESPEPPKAYTAGTWGPSSAIALIERDGRTWHDTSE
jgi:glucose-6-phosphate 1-dehydrogenase